MNFACIRQAMLIILVLGATANGYEKFHGHEGEGSSKLNYDSLQNLATPLENSSEGRQVIEKCLEAYGGFQKLKDLNSVKLHWRMVEMMSSDSVDIIRTAETGRRYKIEKNRPNGFEARMINGNRAWFQNADTTIELNSGRYKAELFSYLVISMPQAMKTERFDEMRYGRREGDSLHYIYMDKHDSLVIIIGIDPDSYMIRKAEGLIRQESATFVFINHFDDYRDHEGYIFPHYLENVSMGLTVGKSSLKSVRVNIDTDESDYLPNSSIGD